MSKRHVLYRMFDAARKLLYVGITCNPPARFAEHADEKDWWRQIATIGLEHFDSRGELEAAEIVAIRAEGPTFNVMHTSRPPRVGGKGSRRKTPPRSWQMADEPWQRFGEVADDFGMSRAALARELVHWYVRWPDATCPPRLAVALAEREAS